MTGPFAADCPYRPAISRALGMGLMNESFALAAFTNPYFGSGLGAIAFQKPRAQTTEFWDIGLIIAFRTSSATVCHTQRPRSANYAE